MVKPKILAICAMGFNRSKYLATYLKNKGYSTRFGGVGHGRIDKYAHNPIKKEDIGWCDIIIVTRKKQKPVLIKKFKEAKKKKILILDVTDSRRIIGKQYPEFNNLDFDTFQRKWTRPQLRKAIKFFLPLKK